jgi:tRNA pseudouridine65 synthase/23S rRNA pseudouridine1911/1915/1917 synthase
MFAILCVVNKPAGVVVYSHKGGGHGTMTVRAALPFVVTPPKPGTYSTLRRPSPVHRLDKPTSGLLLIAKTKPAMVDLSRQFRDRIIKKTYVAVVNGIPFEPVETAISSEGAYDLGVDVDPGSKDTWQLIDHPLDEKSATTIWRSLKYAKSLKANENYVTLVELKPKSGRYHQLRRHMVSFVYNEHCYKRGILYFRINYRLGCASGQLLETISTMGEVRQCTCASAVFFSVPTK